ncbi:unnamed protein product [Brachionus calyciflorus]|uniref:DDHD domain-containing protein n=1 Tax=Brachionus calyciflorus TaxID=104777 RepID=A0A814EGT4_9BILA|nr:unnamed protein product [Brachionus calyciflorus]
MSDTWLYYWFYKLKESDPLWNPFSQKDSDKLENEYSHIKEDQTCLIPVKAGRYDVDIKLKLITPVYWEAENGFVKRFKWSKIKKEIHDEEMNQTLKTFNQSVDPDEIDKFDNVCFIVHGIGEGCDLQLRSILDCANNFKVISNEIINANLKSSQEFNSIEFLPISWHNVLHSDKEKWKDITLPSIPSLRLFSNTAISDMIFYSNSIYRKQITETVVNNLNKYVKKFLERNPYYNGKISLIGHSLGSLILFDLLSNFPSETPNLKFEFKVDNFFAMGSPIPFFLTTRGVNLMDVNFKLNCDFFYNIFHQLDPFAYRIEPMIKSTDIKEPVLINRCNLDSPNSLWKMLTFNSNSQIHKVTNNEYLTQDENVYNYQRICDGFNKNSKLKRIDFALDKTLFENFDYLLFLTAHSSYWDSYDLILFVLKQLYYQDEMEELTEIQENNH